MPIHRHMQRAAGVGAAALVAGVCLTPPAEAQSRCGASYRIQPGDTLYRVSQRCNVSLARIMDLNPELGNPRNIAIGTRLQLVAGGGSGGDSSGGTTAPRDRGDTYRVQSGDTMAQIAARFGVSLFELLSENEDIDPFALAVGEALNIPGDGPAATVSISPQNGPPESVVTVSARHLRPSDYVTIGVGERASEWRALREVRVNGEGAVSADVRVPSWARPGDDLIFVVDTDRGLTLKSGVFDVTKSEPIQRRMELEGRVRAGTECPILETRDGDRYALTSRDVRITTGEYVRIEGRRADMAFCMEGLDTVRVTALEEVAPPRDGDNGGDRMRVEGRVRDGVECPILVTPKGERYALASARNNITVGEYVEIYGTRADVSYCQQGQATISVDSVEEVPPPYRED